MYKLLIVDDEEIERRAIETIIIKNINSISKIMHASNGQEAVAISSTFEPDIIILDITMPGLNGIKAASVIKKFLPDAHIIFLTAFDEFNYAKEAIKLGADDFVVKPASPESIVNTINKSINNIEQVRDIIRKSQLTNDRLKGASQYLEECLVEALVEGESDEKRIEKFLSFTDIEFDCSFGSVISLVFEEDDLYSSTRLETKIKLAVDKIRNEVSKQLNKSIIYNKGMNLYILIYDSNQNYLEKSHILLDHTIKLLQSEMRYKNEINIEYGIGEISSSPDAIWKSFMQAKEKMHSLYNTKTPKDIPGIVESLVQDLTNNHGVDKKKIANIHSVLSNDSATIDDYRVNLIEFSIMLKKRVASKSHRELHLDDKVFIIASKIKNVDEGKVFIEYYLNKLCSIISNDSLDKNAIIVNKMADYIEEHIEENISLDQLSRICKLSPFYISKLFKKYLNTNFIDYVTSIRIRQAKKLLKDPYLSIKEICYKVGYTDPNYFARVFKKETELSPTSFRKQYIL